MSVGLNGKAPSKTMVIKNVWLGFIVNPSGCVCVFVDILTAMSNFHNVTLLRMIFTHWNVSNAS